MSIELQDTATAPETSTGPDQPSSVEVLAAAADVPVDALPEDRFLNRDVSWLDFNSRVLALAADRSAPLLERAKFLAIFASNLDEFFMVRIAGLKRRIAAGVAVPSASGLSPRNVLTRSLEASQDLMARQALAYHEQIVPALAAAGPRGAKSAAATALAFAALAFGHRLVVVLGRGGGVLARLGLRCILRMRTAAALGGLVGAGGIRGLGLGFGLRRHGGRCLVGARRRRGLGAERIALGQVGHRQGGGGQEES